MEQKEAARKLLMQKEGVASARIGEVKSAQVLDGKSSSVNIRLNPNDSRNHKSPGRSLRPGDRTKDSANDSPASRRTITFSVRT